MGGGGGGEQIGKKKKWMKKKNPPPALYLYLFINLWHGYSLRSALRHKGGGIWSYFTS